MDEANLRGFRAFLTQLTEVWNFIRTFPKPTIAAINGVVVGAGFELALVCDFRIAASTSRLGSAEVRIGQPMTNGSTYLLSRLIGEAKAKEIGMTGCLVDATEARRMGLVNAVAELGALERTVGEFIDGLLRGAPLALAKVKQCIAYGREADIEGAVMAENEASTVCFESADQREGFRAFLEKRAPQWGG